MCRRNVNILLITGIVTAGSLFYFISAHNNSSTSEAKAEVIKENDFSTTSDKQTVVLQESGSKGNNTPVKTEEITASEYSNFERTIDKLMESTF